MTPFVYLLFGLPLALVILGYSGVDQLTTLGVSGTWINVTAMGGLGAAAGLNLINQWSRPDAILNAKWEYIKRDRPGLWWLVLLSCALVAGLVSGWLVGRVLGIGAQYLSGPVSIVPARVVTTYPSWSGRAMCSLNAQVHVATSGEDYSICLETSSRKPLETAPIRAGGRVNIHVRTTLLGSVVESVDPK
jgi:hypothetical protein